jgi:nucleoside-triphosphatase THEP1
MRSLPFSLRAAKLPGSSHTLWRLLEHLRIAQWDILEFSRDPGHVSPEFPGGYWPEGDAPSDPAAWEESISRFLSDLEQMQDLVANPETDLLARIPHGTGQTILREALLVADHNAYHLGQMVMILRALEESSPSGGEGTKTFLLLTGAPGVGKTTVIRRVLAELGDRARAGFVTDEIREEGRRRGFRLETLDGESVILAHLDIKSPHRLGRYGVDVEALDGILDRALPSDPQIDLFLVDEIGKMECFSERFTVAITGLLDSGQRGVATINQRAGGFVGAVRERPEVTLWEVTRENRDEMPGRVLEWIESGETRP